MLFFPIRTLKPTNAGLQAGIDVSGATFIGAIR
jgi:hypothetical protein